MTVDPSAPDSSGARRVADPGSSTVGGPARRAAGGAAFSGVLGWTVLGAVIPGLGLIKAGRRLAGGLVLGLYVLVLGGAAALYLTNQRWVTSQLVKPDVLQGIAGLLLTIAVTWVAVIGLSHLSLRPANPSVAQRAASAAVVGLLSFLVAAPLAVGANAAWSTAGAVRTIFGEDTEPNSTQPTLNAEDPWRDKDRLNILILGGDSGNNRSSALGDRTDTVMVASVDTHSGATTLFTLPRNTERMPFPKDSPLHGYYPNGFYNGTGPDRAEYLLNAMYRNVPGRVPDDVLGKTKNFAADVVKVSVGEALGLDLDYYVLVNMDGFRDFINAIGGITVNVNYRIPIGGNTDQRRPPESYIEPGPNQHLKGRLALWYARGRYGLDDYKRMERQRCVINAVVQQTSPQAVLTNFQSILAAGEKTIQTDVPGRLLPDLVELGMKVKGTPLRSVVFTPGVAGFQSYNPNWPAVRARVQKALKETAKGVPDPSATPSATSTASATPTASGTSSPSASSSPSKTPKPKSDDLEDICGYHPEKP